MLPAFQSIELLRNYRSAEEAIAKRWATTQSEGSSRASISPDQKSNLMNKMDMKSEIIAPFYVTIETHGTEGQVLNVEEKVKEVKEDIVAALGLSRSPVSGDGPNFATASVSMQKMLVMIREIKHAALTILEWVYDDWLELAGHNGKFHFVRVAHLARLPADSYGMPQSGLSQLLILESKSLRYACLGKSANSSADTGECSF